MRRLVSLSVEMLHDNFDVVMSIFLERIYWSRKWTENWASVWEWRYEAFRWRGPIFRWHNFFPWKWCLLEFMKFDSRRMCNAEEGKALTACLTWVKIGRQLESPKENEVYIQRFEGGLLLTGKDLKVLWFHSSVEVVRLGWSLGHSTIASEREKICECSRNLWNIRYRQMWVCCLKWHSTHKGGDFHHYHLLTTKGICSTVPWCGMNFM